jgi:hypothetical protein
MTAPCNSCTGRSPRQPKVAVILEDIEEGRGMGEPTLPSIAPLPYERAIAVRACHCRTSVPPP